MISPGAESFKRGKNKNREIRKNKDIHVQDILPACIVEFLRILSTIKERETNVLQLYLI